MSYKLTSLHPCPCGSGETGDPRYDARGIYICRACDKCWPERAKLYRDDIFTDANYWHDEPIEPED